MSTVTTSPETLAQDASNPGLREAVTTATVKAKRIKATPAPVQTTAPVVGSIAIIAATELYKRTEWEHNVRYMGMEYSREEALQAIKADDRTTTLANTIRAKGWDAGSVLIGYIAQDGQVYITEGHRRLYVSGVIGLQTVPVAIYTEDEARERALRANGRALRAENSDVVRLNLVERLIQEGQDKNGKSPTDNALALATGESLASIRATRQLLNLPPHILTPYREGRIPATVAHYLAKEEVSEDQIDDMSNDEGDFPKLQTESGAALTLSALRAKAAKSEPQTPEPQEGEGEGEGNAKAHAGQGKGPKDKRAGFLRKAAKNPNGFASVIAVQPIDGDAVHAVLHGLASRIVDTLTMDTAQWLEREAQWKANSAKVEALSEEQQDEAQADLDRQALELGESPSSMVDDFIETGTPHPHLSPVIVQDVRTLLALSMCHVGGVYDPSLLPFANEGRGSDENPKYEALNPVQAFAAITALLVGGDAVQGFGEVSGMADALQRITQAEHKAREDEEKEKEKEAQEKADKLKAKQAKAEKKLKRKDTSK